MVAVRKHQPGNGRKQPISPYFHLFCENSHVETAYSAHSTQSNFACSKTVCVAFSCLSGG